MDEKSIDDTNVKNALKRGRPFNNEAFWGSHTLALLIFLTSPVSFALIVLLSALIAVGRGPVFGLTPQVMNENKEPLYLSNSN